MVADEQRSISEQELVTSYRAIQGELSELENLEYTRKRRIKELTEKRDALKVAKAILFPEKQYTAEDDEEEEESDSKK